MEFKKTVIDAPGKRKKKKKRKKKASKSNCYENISRKDREKPCHIREKVTEVTIPGQD